MGFEYSIAPNCMIVGTRNRYNAQSSFKHWLRHFVMLLLRQLMRTNFWIETRNEITHG